MMNNIYLPILSNQFYLWLFFVIGFQSIAQKKALPIEVPKNHLRIATWNIKYLGERSPLRTDEQLEKIANRIKELNFSVVGLQEIQSNKRINDLVNLLGANWKVSPKAGWITEPPSENETCLLWNTSKVKCLNTYAWTGCVGYKSRPPFSGIFQPVKKEGKPFVVISNHAYPGGSKKAKMLRVKQGKFYRQMVLEMLKDTLYPKSIYLVGDFNGKSKKPPHTTIQPKNEAVILNLVNKSDNRGTMAKLINSNIDHIYATNEGFYRVHKKKSYVVRPKHFNESCRTFNKIYSDHLPVFVDIIIATK